MSEEISSEGESYNDRLRGVGKKKKAKPKSEKEDEKIEITLR